MEKIELLQKFENLLSKIEPQYQAEFIQAFAHITPKTADAPVEWRKRLHYQVDGRIQAGAYLFVHDAQPRELTNWTEIIALFLENRHQETGEILEEVLEAIENEMLAPYDFRMGVSTYISENQGAFMFSFTAQATPEAHEKYRQKHHELDQQFA